MPPKIGPGRAELSSSVVPTFANSGHWASSVVPIRASASEQVVLPSAAFGLIENPSGRLTLAARISEAEGVSGLICCGTFRDASSPLGASASGVDGFAAREGLKPSWSQPVVAAQGALPWCTTWS